MNRKNISKEIEKILLDELCGIYCYNCQFEFIDEKEAEEKYQYYGCDDCHRKYMGWKLSEQSAKDISHRIIDVIKWAKDDGTLLDLLYQENKE